MKTPALHELLLLCGGGDPMCFVSRDLFVRARIEQDIKLVEDGRIGYSLEVFMEAGLPHFLCFGCWIVLEEHKEKALEAYAKI
jgi:hypothetical protein